MNHLYMPTLLKAFDILDCFQGIRHELGISDISAMIDMPVSSVHRIIQTLEFQGALLQNHENKKYRLGSAMLTLSEKCIHYEQYEMIAAGYVDRLMEATGETTNLSIRSCDKSIDIYHAESTQVLRPNFPLNVPFPAYNTSVGRVFLSFMSDVALKWIYENNAEDIHMSQDAFLSMLHLARKQGYALDDQELSAGLRCVAAPILLAHDTPIFAISVSAPVTRMDDAQFEKTAQLVAEFASEASREIAALAQK